MFERFAQAPGNTRLMCFGYCLTGPPAAYPKVLWSVIIGLFVIWSGAVAPSLWQFSRGAVYYSAFLLLLMVVTYLRIACVDPGIIPRNAPRFQPKRGDAGDNSTTSINARFSSRMCKHCGVEKPPQAYHCQICNVCVLQLDHHCPVLGTCIAARNIKFFNAFLMLGSALGYFCLATAVFVLVVELTKEDGRSGAIHILLLVFFGMTGFCVLGSLSYVCSHLWPALGAAAPASSATGSPQTKRQHAEPPRVPVQLCGVDQSCRLPASMLVGEGARIAAQPWHEADGNAGSALAPAANAEEVSVEMGAVAVTARAASAVESVNSARPVWQQPPKSRPKSSGSDADGALSISNAGADV